MASNESTLPRPLFATVFLLSVGVLMLQIALSRIFSYTIWYHFAYISVSLALLGFGASGSLLAAFPRLAGRSIDRTSGLYCALCALATLLVLLIVGGIQLSPFDVLKSPLELAKLVLFFGAVSLPFFFAGLVITLALSAAGREVNRLYCWDLVGAGLGCALVVACIDWLETPRVLALVAVLFAAAGAIAGGQRAPGVRNLNLGVGLLLLVLIGPLPPKLPFTPSPDKEIYAWLMLDMDFYTRWSAIFRTDLITGGEGVARDGGYRGAGMSKRFRSPSPPFRFIAHDGTAFAIMYKVEDGLRDFEMFRHHILTVPYVLRKNPEVLIIGVGGGADVLNGLVNGASHITGAELDPLTIELITKTYRDFTGGIFDRPDVTLHVGEGRHFARSTDRRFDIVQITGVDTLAALSSGAYILSENYLYTTDAYEEYFRTLRDGGVLSIGTMDFHPRAEHPRHALRFAALSYEALRRRGVERPHEHVMIVGNDDKVPLIEILTKLEPFSEDEIAATERFVDEAGFEAWYMPGRPARQLPMFRTVLEGSPPERDRFFEDTFLDLRPTTDDRPFFFSYYKWRNLFERRDDIDRGHTLATGQIVLAMILVLAILASVVAIVLPLARVGGAGRMPGRWGFLAYFAGLGVGFIFAEITFVQIFIHFLGYPTYSLTVTLFSFLTAAGIGALLSGRLPDDPRRTLPLLVGALTLLIAGYALMLPLIFQAVLAEPLAVRIATTVALCTPLGAVLGMFFPYGIRLTSAIDRGFVAWAWAVNGCLTVVGSVSSIILAMTFGFSTVLVLVVVTYWLAAASFVATYSRVSGVSDLPDT